MTTFQRCRPAVVLPFLTILAGACHRGDDPTPAELVVTGANDAGATPTIVPLAYTPAPPTKPLGADFAFDLDNAQYLPTPAGSPQVLAPWAPTASRAFSDDMRDDHKQAEGWAVVYSAFSRSASFSNPYIVLYNKYRGLLRLYYYAAAGAPTLHDHNALVSTVKLEGGLGNTSPLLSFADQAVVDPSTNSALASSLEPQALGDPTWYATQIELAYDPNIAKFSATSLYLRWELTGAQVTSLALNNFPLGTTLPVGIQAPGVDFAATPTYNGLVGLRLTGPASLAKLQQGPLPGAVAERILAQYSTDAWYQGSVPVMRAGLGAQAYLPTPAQVSTRADVGLTSTIFAFPGYDNSAVVGFAPQYNEAPGVFFLADRPVIIAKKLASGDQPYTYSLDAASVKYLFNPAVQTTADIRNITQEIVATAAGTDLNTTVYAANKLSANQELTIQGVRVSFDVVPKAGNSPIIRIVKTFKANIR
ncbi:MAG: hypothetical protein ACRYG7_12255 [Janthinobacterium lividum]